MGWIIFGIIVAILALTKNGRRLVSNLLGRGNDGLGQLADNSKRDPQAVIKEGEQQVRAAQTEVKNNLIAQETEIKGVKREISIIEQAIAKERTEAAQLNAKPTDNPAQREQQLRARFERIQKQQAELARKRKELLTLEANAAQDRKNLDKLENSADELHARGREASSNQRRAESIETSNRATQVTQDALKEDSSVSEAEAAVQQRLARAEATRDVEAPVDDGSAELEQAKNDANFADFLNGLDKPAGK
jgi:uncharacterized phage infection (PIP) family protein YhgE